MKKRVISLLLLLVMLVGMLPVYAQAEEPETQLDSGDMTVEGTNGFGDLLVEDIVQKQEDMEAQSHSGYTLTDLEITGNTATVTYDSLEEATVVVAIYTEDRMQLLTSGKTTVSPEETTATVTIAGEMPQYFIATAYLLDSYDLSPLCPAYETPLYTKEMQELLASTAEDYDPDRVLQLEESPETNFAVYAEGTKVIEYVEGVNTVSAVDSETNTYIIENTNESITSLQPGDVFAYPYREGDVLIVKVASITLVGTTATITGGELELEEVFSHVKIQGEGDNEDISVDDSTTHPSLSYQGLVQETPRTRALSGGASGSPFHEYKFGGKIEEETEHLSASVSINGSLKVSLSVNLEYYISGEKRYIELKLTDSITFGIYATGRITGSLPIGEFGIRPCPGVFIGFEPKLKISFTGTADLTVTASITLGFRYDKENGFQNISTAPRVDPIIKIELTLFFGVDLCPKIAILGEGFAELKLEAEFGVELESKATGTMYENLTGVEDTLHNCKECMAISFTVKGNLGGTIEIQDGEWLELKVDIGKWDWNVGNAYFSFDLEEFGPGTCPNQLYRLTMFVVNGYMHPCSGADITCATSDGITTLGTTNGNGVLVTYLPGGNYQIKANWNVCEGTEDVELTQAHTIRIVPTIPQSGGITPSSDKTTILGGLTEEDKIAIGIVDKFPLTASGFCGTNLVWELYSNGALHIRGAGEMTDYSKASDAPWCAYRGSIKKVILHNGVTGIGDRAFNGCTGLSSVSIPDSVTTIGAYAFNGCIGLSSISIPDGVTTIGAYAFNGCSNLATVQLPNGITKIEHNTFEGCDRLTSVTIPDSVKHIGYEAFYECHQLAVLRIGKGVTSVGSSAFYGCSSLRDVYITDIAAWCQIDYNDSFSSPMNYATQLYLDDILLTELNIPKGVTKIASSAFENCKYITSVAIPDSVTGIGTNAFSGCSSLSSVNIPDRVTSIGSMAFFGCSSLVSVNIPDGVTSIGTSAFNRCANLTAVSIPDSVTSIGADAFHDCHNLTSVKLPNGITKIEAYTFRSCYSLLSVTLPDSVTEIGFMAFDNCYDLVSVRMGKGITYVGADAFSDCRRLQDVYITDLAAWCQIDYETPSSMPMNYASKLYLDDILLTELNIPKGITKIAPSAFVNCKYITSVTIPDSVTTIGAYAFNGCIGLSSISIPDGVTSIGAHAFNGCSNLATVQLPNGITKIESNTFKGCNSMTSVTIPDGITYIGSSAFDGCSSLTTVVIGKGVVSIGNNAFYGCSSLSSISIPDGVTSIGYHAFNGCSNLTSVKLPNGLVKIEHNTFNSCDSLTSVTIPDSVTNVGGYAFRYCSSLEKVYYTGTQEQWNAISFGNGNGYLINATVYYEFGGGGMSGRSGAVVNGGILTGTVEGALPVSNAVFGGSYGTEMEDDRTVKTAEFTNLVAGKEYVLLAMVDVSAEDPLAAENLLYIRQAAADQDGNISFRYVQRVDTQVSYVMACGASNKDLNDAVITFPEMTANGETNVVNPTVVYEGKTLLEGQDYVITGEVSFTEAGEYTCYIRGIYNYAGLVTCTYQVAQPSVVQPTITLKYPTLSFKDEILINVYFEAENLENVVDMGLITYGAQVDSWNINNAEKVIPGYQFSQAKELYVVTSEGIPAKNMVDTLWFAIYAQLSDGSYYYTKLVNYSPKMYADSLLGTQEKELDALLVSMLNYGAAAQTYFGYRTNDLVNKDLTAAQLATVSGYRSDMVITSGTVPAEKQGTFTYNEGFTHRSPSVSFKGAFAINYYCVPQATPVDGITLYYWNEAAYTANQVLTPENATGTAQMVLNADGKYVASVKGIPARQVNDIVYVALRYSDGTTTYNSGILPYSIGEYCGYYAGIQHEFTPMAQATAVYGHYAKQYFK